MSRIDGPATPRPDNAVYHHGSIKGRKVEYGYDEQSNLAVNQVNFWDDTPFHNFITGKPQGKMGVSFHYGQQCDAQDKLAQIQREDILKETFRKTVDCLLHPFGGAPDFIGVPRAKIQIEHDQQNVVNHYMMEKYEGRKFSPK